MARLTLVATAIAALIATAWCADSHVPITLDKNYFFKGKITYTVTASCEIADAEKEKYLVDAAGIFEAKLGAYDTDHYPVTLTPCTGAAVELQQIVANDKSGKLLAASLNKKLALVYYTVAAAEADAEPVKTLAVVTDAATKTHVVNDAVDSAQLAISGDKYIVAYKKGAVSQLVVLGGATDIDKELTAAVTLDANGLHFTEGGKSYTVAFTSDLFTDAAKTLADCSEKTEDQTVTIDDSMKQAYKDIAKEFTGKIVPAGAVEVCPVKVSGGDFGVDKVSCAGADVVADTKGTRYSAVCADTQAKAYAMYQLAVVVPESAAGISGSTGSFATTLGTTVPVGAVAGVAAPTIYATTATEGKIHVATGSFAFVAQELAAPEIGGPIEVKHNGEPVDISTLVATEGITASAVRYDNGVYCAITEAEDATATCNRATKKTYKVYTLGKEQEPKEVKICADAVLEKHHDKFIAVNISADPKKVEVIEIPITGNAKVIGTVTDYDIPAGTALTPIIVDAEQQFMIASSADTTFYVFNYKGNFMNTVAAAGVMSVGDAIVVTVATATEQLMHVLKTTDDLFTKKGGQLDPARGDTIDAAYSGAAASVMSHLLVLIDKKIVTPAFKVEGLKAEPKSVQYSSMNGTAAKSGATIVSEAKGETTLHHVLGQEIDGGKFTFGLGELSFDFVQFNATTVPTDVEIVSVPGTCRMTYKEGDKTFIQLCGSIKSPEKDEGLSAGAIAGIVIAVVVVVVAVVLLLYFFVFKKK